ncbi:hypothetical protein A3765_28510 [Oleiphilus sp. HI0130]|nr:hypothetical protein A3765_28775 [Oleiphilus sp. HI0130]KZZ72495.1 hypothetical protein A3765_28510 [Oleiphilus sp. HI0130]
MLNVTFFRGSRPKIQPHLLETGEAQKAINCRLQTGALEAFRGPSLERAISVASVASLFKYADTNYWFEFQQDANVAEGPIASDTESTTYFTGDGEPAMTYASIATQGNAPYPSNRYRLGLPAPADTFDVTVTGTANPVDDNADSRAYTFTYVSARGEEGPPSLPSDIVDVLLGEEVSITNIPVAPSGNYNVTSKRIYRTSTASGDTDYLFVAEIPVAQTTYTDTLASESLGEVLPSVDWHAPPSDMIGLTSCANGVLAGFSGKELYLSEQYLPHAWPYSLTMDRPIVGIVSVRGGLVVATDGKPVIVAFTSPSAAAQYEIETPRACISKRSMVDMGDYAIYATGDGLVAVDSSGQAPLITQNVIDRYQWQKFNPETIHAYRKENWYVGFYQGQSVSGGFAITARGDTFIEFDFYADAGFVDPKTGDLYLVIDGDIVKWDDDAANPIPYRWVSAETLLASSQNIAAARVDAESYPVTFELYSEGNLLHTQSVTSSEPFWLPGNYLVRRYHIAIEGSTRVRAAFAAETLEAVQ